MEPILHPSPSQKYRGLLWVVSVPFRGEQEITDMVWDTKYIDLVHCVQQVPGVLTSGTQLECMACQTLQLFLLGPNWVTHVWMENGQHSGVKLPLHNVKSNHTLTSLNAA